MVTRAWHSVGNRPLPTAAHKKPPPPPAAATFLRTPRALSGASVSTPPPAPPLAPGRLCIEVAFRAEALPIGRTCWALSLLLRALPLLFRAVPFELALQGFTRPFQSSRSSPRYLTIPAL